MHGLDPKDRPSTDANSPKVDWGLTSEDYDRWRPNYPPLFYERLQQWEIGLPGQRVLDMGTGVGFIARTLAQQGADCFAFDLSVQQAQQGAHSAQKEAVAGGHSPPRFLAARAEAIPFAEDSFDVAVASQCWPYFDTAQALAELRRVLRPPHSWLTCHFCWLPRLDAIARDCEDIILRFNPDWAGKDWSGEIPGTPPWAIPYREGAWPPVQVEGSFWFDVEMPFTREQWLGRLRACRGVGATLPPTEVATINQALDQYLREAVGEVFCIRHRVDAHFFTLV